MHTSLPDRITISPLIWPGKELEAQPGDMSIIVPQGLGLSGPFPIRPWDDPITVNPGQYYGFQGRTGHPLQDAPTNTASGGVVYLDDNVAGEDLLAACRLLGIPGRERQYAAFLQESQHPLTQRFLVQLKLVTRFALNYLFRAIESEQYDKFPEQPLSMGELMVAFLSDQQQHWGTGMSSELSGCMGGDGDWAKESLAFGLMVENDYHGVYRIWSRAWLVTK